MLKRQYKINPLQSTMDLGLTLMGIRGCQLSFDIAASAKQSFRTAGNLSRRLPTHNLHMAFKIPYEYDMVTELCRQQS
jgi:hypothetical protein